MKRKRMAYFEEQSSNRQTSKKLFVPKIVVVGCGLLTTLVGIVTGPPDSFHIQEPELVNTEVICCNHSKRAPLLCGRRPKT